MPASSWQSSEASVVAEAEVSYICLLQVLPLSVVAASDAAEHSASADGEAWPEASEVLIEDAAADGKGRKGDHGLTRRDALKRLAFLVDPPKGVALRILSGVRTYEYLSICATMSIVLPSSRSVGFMNDSLFLVWLKRAPMQACVHD